MANYNYNKDPQGIARVRSEKGDRGLGYIIDIINSKLEKKDIIKIFEPGCGGGRNLIFLKEKFGNSIKVFGSDISEISIDHASKKTVGNFVVAKTTDDCFKEKFDLIIMLDILEHLVSKDEAEQTIKLAKEKLVDAGLLVISCPIESNRYSIMWFFKKINFWPDLTLKYYGHTLQFKRDELLEMLKKYCNILEVSYSVHFLSQLDTLLFFYLPKQFFNFIGGNSVVSLLRESNIKISDGDRFSWKNVFLKIYFLIRRPFLFGGFYESKLRKRSSVGAMNMYVKCY